MAGRPDPVTNRQPPVIPLRFGVGKAPSAPTVPDTPPLGAEVVYLLEDEETLRKVPSMLPLLSGTVKSPRIPIQQPEGGRAPRRVAETGGSGPARVRGHVKSGI